MIKNRTFLVSMTLITVLLLCGLNWFINNRSEITNERYTYINYQFSSHIYDSYLTLLTSLLKDGSLHSQSFLNYEESITAWNKSLEETLQRTQLIKPSMESDMQKKNALEFWRVRENMSLKELRNQAIEDINYIHQYALNYDISLMRSIGRAKHSYINYLEQLKHMSPF